MVPLPPLRDGGCALPICPFGRACLPLISDAPDCTCSPGRLWFLGGVGELPGSRCTDFNPRAPCGARPGRQGPHRQGLHISIHAPRVGRDALRQDARCAGINFNPRAPCGARPSRPRSTRRASANFNPRAPCGARPLDWEEYPGYEEFQSTRPVWGATGVPVDLMSSQFYFNPRAPCGARPAAREWTVIAMPFQSTRPVWGATAVVREHDDPAVISIHAPRVGRDAAARQAVPVAGHFNPRAPCGARPRWRCAGA